MSFFKSSFSSFGEALRTVSLAIGLLVTSVTGVGYIYHLISEQKAQAVTLKDHGARIESLETESQKVILDRFRLQQVEKGVGRIEEKMDKLADAINDLRAGN